MRVALALSCAGLIAGLCSVQASADDLGCADIKRALVAANLDFMRIERGPLPPAPVQAALVIGEMTALTRLAQGVCGDSDAGMITKVVGQRLTALQKLLPVGPEGPASPTADTADTAAAEDPPAPTASSPPTPPLAPPSESRRHAARKAEGSTSCRRSYYMKEGHRYWRCKR